MSRSGASRTPKNYAKGIEFEFTVKGTVATVKQSGDVVVRTPDDRYWQVPANAKWVTTKATIPAHAAVRSGQVWNTHDGLYFARRSRSDLPLRLTPEDLTEENGLKTLEEDAFFTRYPNAKLVFPSPTTRQKLSAYAPDHYAAANGASFLAPATK